MQSRADAVTIYDVNNFLETRGIVCKKKNFYRVSSSVDYGIKVSFSPVGLLITLVKPSLVYYNFVFGPRCMTIYGMCFLASI